MSIKSVAARAGDHPILEFGARLGYVASGLVHLLMAWLTLRLAWGDRGGSADQSGAFSTLVKTPGGGPLLVAAAVGLGLLGLWHITEALRAGSWPERAKAAGKAVAYAALAGSAVTILTTGHASSEAQARDVTRSLMLWPAGPILVGLLGVGILAIAGYHVLKGARQKFLDNRVDDPGLVARVAGAVGYVGKGIALAVVGALFVAAAATHDPSEAKGLDGALATLLGVPLGAVLITVVAAGLGCYALYPFARARYGRL